MVQVPLASRQVFATLLLTALGCPVPGSAQNDSGPQIQSPLTAGTQVVVGQLSRGNPSPRIEAQVDKNPVGIADTSFAADHFRITLKFPLKAGETVRVRDQPNGPWSAEVEVLEGEPTGGGPAAHQEGAGAPMESNSAERGEVLEASAYLGTAYDNFAASEIKSYLNQDDSNTTQTRFIFGFDFEYLLVGSPWHRDLPASQANAPGGSGESIPSKTRLYVFGETLHGVRSADVDCSAPEQERPPVCNSTPLGANIPEQARFILRNATSLEAFVGLRWEFFELQRNSPSPASLYLKGQAGFLSVSNIGGDVVDMHQVGFGIIAKDGRLRDSYVELGFGRTDLFLDHRNRRWKVDGYLAFEVGKSSIEHAIRPFAQITVDSDFGSGSDSVQSYVGIDFDVGLLFQGKTVW